MLQPATRGGYDVVRTATGGHGIQVGDRVLEVDGKDVTRAPVARVLGVPGDPRGRLHTLLLQRGTTRVRARATVPAVFP